MIQSFLYSIRMRASVQDRHLSGAERIVSHAELDQAASELRSRAMSKTLAPDRIVITIEALNAGAVACIQSLPLKTIPSASVNEARDEAIKRLEHVGVASAVSRNAISLLDSGASASGTNMRGAIIMSAIGGIRLEPDQERGVRVSRFDWSRATLPLLELQLKAAGLGHFRTREALALATKVAHAQGIVAELCWSDDPDYTAGYVASPLTGYIRFPMLKHPGHGKGGRVFFVDDEGFDIARFLDFLEKQPVLIDAAVNGLIHQ